MNKLKQILGSLGTFIQEVKVELQKCTWPTRKELFGQSMVVVVSVIILGAFVYVCDLLNGGFLSLVIHN